MRKDIFILVIGYGKTGTSLCTGLLDSSPDLKLGYEIYNPLIYSYEDSRTVLSKDFNGNKITINSDVFLDRMKFLIENKTGFMHDQFETLKVVFTKRDPIDALVCRHGYFLNKGRKPSVEGLVNDYLKTVSLLENLKNYFTERSVSWYLFNFDDVLADPFGESKKLFNFVGEEFEEEYVTEYRGENNYTHAVGVVVENVLFGRKGKFPELRKKLVKEFMKQTFLEKNKKMIDNLGVIIPTHIWHDITIPKCIESCRVFNPKCIVLSQDFSAGVFLSLEIQDLADEVIFQKIGGRSRHWLYQQKAGVSSLKKRGIDYMFSLNGDCVVEKPERFLSFYEKFVDSGADLMCCAYHVNFKGGLTLGTMGLIAKVESMNGILDIMIADFGDWIKLSCEKRLLYATEKGGYEVLEVENPEHHHFWPEKNPNRTGTWMKEIGFVHLHKEWEDVWREKKRLGKIGRK